MKFLRMDGLDQDMGEDQAPFLSKRCSDFLGENILIIINAVDPTIE